MNTVTVTVGRNVGWNAMGDSEWISLQGAVGGALWEAGVTTIASPFYYSSPSSVAVLAAPDGKTAEQECAIFHATLPRNFNKARRGEFEHALASIASTAGQGAMSLTYGKSRLVYPM